MDSIKKLRAICQDPLSTYSWPVRNIRRISIYYTKFFLATRFSANQVTLSGIIMGLLSGLCFSVGTYWYSLLGGILYCQYVLLDYADGEVARCTTTSIAGEYLERVSHDIVDPLVFFIGITFGVYNALGDPKVIILGLSSVTSILLIRSVHSHFTNLQVFHKEVDPVKKASKQYGIIGIVTKFLKSTTGTNWFRSSIILVAAVVDLILQSYKIVVPFIWSNCMFMILFFSGVVLPIIYFISVCALFFKLKKVHLVVGSEN